MKDYKDLIVWQKAIRLVTLVYHLTSDFPREELYGLTSQIRRAAVSIPSNIAEGSQRSTKNDFGHFIKIAKGSTAELETQLIIADNLFYIKDKQKLKRCVSLLIEIKKMLSGLYAKI